MVVDFIWRLYSGYKQGQENEAKRVAKAKANMQAVFLIPSRDGGPGNANERRCMGT